MNLTIQDAARSPSVDWHSRLYQRNTEVIAVETVAAVGDAQATSPAKLHTGVAEAVATPIAEVFPTIADALQWVRTWADQTRTPTDPVEESSRKRRPHIQVLITGSLHLVGGVIKVLDPELVNRPGS